MRLTYPIRTGQVRIEFKEVVPKENQRGYGYGKCKTLTVYETSSEELYKLVLALLEKEAKK